MDTETLAKTSAKATRIVWMSRHAPTPSQVMELDRLFPNHDFFTDPRAFSDAADIVKRFRRLNGDELVVVAPLNVINEIVKQGVNPLIAIMERCAPAEADVVLGRGSSRRWQRFLRFERSNGVNHMTEPVIKV